MRQISKVFLFASLIVAMSPTQSAMGAESAPAAKSPPPARPTIYRLNQVEEAKKRAIAEDKPIAWIGGVVAHLEPYDKPQGKGSHAATAYAIAALQKDTIMVFSDGQTENHTEPPIVDQALHSPNPHYNIPYVIILTPSLDKVICKAPYAAEFSERVKIYTAVLNEIRDKSKWHSQLPEEKAGK